MDRSIKSGRLTAPRLALAVTTAIAGLAMTGCMTSAAPRADRSFSSAQAALANGQVDKAIAHAEAAVLAEPRNPGFRALLGAAYLEAGRFQSAAVSFADALDLGDENPRTVLSYALTKIALGEGRAAVAVLDDYAGAIDAADLGLALALAGEPERGTGVLVNAIRASHEASPKLRQNLAYSYALAGNWRAARVMAAEDVPADQLDVRLSRWASMSAPEMFQQRIATLLDVASRADSGQPQRLALANFPSREAMVAEAAAQAPVKMAEAAPAVTFAQAFAAPEAAGETATAPDAAARFVSNAVVQQLPAVSTRRDPTTPSIAAAAPQRRPAAAAAAVVTSLDSDKPAGTHLVQLGSYDSKIEAERGWTVIRAKFPQLKDHKPVITQAVVSGRTFWRIAAEGFGPQSAKAMCGTVKSAGRGCFAYAASAPPAGAVQQREVQVAVRGR
jgi:Flp pilus assembly protein TadD